MNLVTRVESALHDAGVAHDERLLIALSGGPDSSALLSACVELKDPNRVGACHFDHALRSEDERYAERRSVVRLCDRLGVVLHAGAAERGEAQEVASREQCGIEAACRILRYRFLIEILDAEQFGRLLLGHHSEDRIETVMLRFFQGSGYGGMPGFTGLDARILRPLMAVTQQEIDAYLDTRGIAPYFDTSNEDGRFLRNTIRRELMPLVTRIFPGYVRGVESYAEKAQITHDFLLNESRIRIPIESSADRRKVSIERETFYDAHPVLRLYALYKATDLVWRSEAAMQPRLTYRSVRPLLFSSDDGNKERKVMLRTKSIEIIRCAELFECRARVVFESEKSYLFVIRESDNRDIALHDRRLRIGATRDSAESVEVPIERFPAVVRPCLPGEDLTTVDWETKEDEEVTVGKVAGDRAVLIEDGIGVAALLTPDQSLIRKRVSSRYSLFATMRATGEDRSGDERAGTRRP